MMAYEKFEAWQAAHRLALLVYDITDRWPIQERYQLTSQVRRAALSIPTNISEGAAKNGDGQSSAGTLILREAPFQNSLTFCTLA
jgi:four helix bundle protein